MELNFFGLYRAERPLWFSRARNWVMEVGILRNDWTSSSFGLEFDVSFTSDWGRLECANGLLTREEVRCLTRLAEGAIATGLSRPSGSFVSTCVRDVSSHFKARLACSGSFIQEKERRGPWYWLCDVEAIGATGKRYESIPMSPISMSLLVINMPASERAEQTREENLSMTVSVEWWWTYLSDERSIEAYWNQVSRACREYSIENVYLLLRAHSHCCYYSYWKFEWSYFRHIRPLNEV